MNNPSETNRPGWFGPFGGAFVPETLVEPLRELEAAYAQARRDPRFKAELKHELATFVGRPTPLTFAGRLSAALGLRVWLKREDLTHTGAHKINNTVGQVLLARRMGKRRVIAETGAGQHGVATAAAAARAGLPCVVYMGTEDMARQAPNVARMRMMGAVVAAVDAGSRTLKDATSEALRAWSADTQTTFYVLGSALGPHPYPTMVRDFQTVIGVEARAQILKEEGRLPREIIACVGGGSNAMGIFTAFLKDKAVALTGVEAGGTGPGPGRHAARFAGGHPGVLHGTYTYLLQDKNGQVLPTHSISAGLDYPAVGPEHAELRRIGRARYAQASDKDALAAAHELCRLEGILPALESSHAIAYLIKAKRRFKKSDLIMVNLSGRGDKDLGTLCP
ncbi:MAG: tryptophan synthase subunit beta [Elusimicrobia bacterium CG11_big_fil_rev_8_21_14_0_20_64_6]|nr:MAG: tryptophan synthase subunit beta [Elusimicrobia bacterium CG11_big_fil_rev_8_21_14_0_20_64_6]